MRRWPFVLLLMATLPISGLSVRGAALRVPEDHETIRAAVDAA
jgi:hypothetical protein